MEATSPGLIALKTERKKDRKTESKRSLKKKNPPTEDERRIK